MTTHAKLLATACLGLAACTAVPGGEAPATLAPATGTAAEGLDGRRELMLFAAETAAESQPFEIAAPWGLHWHASEAQGFRLVLVGENGRTLIADLPDGPWATSPKSGHRLFAAGGTYRLAVDAQGPWQISVYGY